MERRQPISIEDFLRQNFILRSDDSIDHDMLIALTQADSLIPPKTQNHKT